MPLNTWSDNITIAELSDEPMFSEDMDGLLQRLEEAVKSEESIPNVVVDLKSVATVNSSTPKIFLNQTKAGQSMAVRLIGPKGNLRGVGSRVSVKLKSGATLVGEVHCGSSYLTGSSTDLFFTIPAGDEAVSLLVRSPLARIVEKKLTTSAGLVSVVLP